MQRGVARFVPQGAQAHSCHTVLGAAWWRTTRVAAHANGPRSPPGGISGSASSGRPTVALHRPPVALLAASLATLANVTSRPSVASRTVAGAPSRLSDAPVAVAGAGEHGGKLRASPCAAHPERACMKNRTRLQTAVAAARRAGVSPRAERRGRKGGGEGGVARWRTVVGLQGCVPLEVTCQVGRPDGGMVQRRVCRARTRTCSVQVPGWVCPTAACAAHALPCLVPHPALVVPYQSTEGSKRAMLVVTQRRRPGVAHESENGTWGRAEAGARAAVCKGRVSGGQPGAQEDCSEHVRRAMRRARGVARAPAVPAGRPVQSRLPAR